MGQHWFANTKSAQSLLAPIDDLWRNKEEWTLAVADVSSESRSGHEPRNGAVAIYNSTKGDVQSQIDVLLDAPGSRLTLQAQDAMKIAELSKNKWQSDRQQSSRRKIAAAFQSSMTTFSQFLDNFSGIAEIAKSADQQYGGLAYGTLSLMLSVFVHKTQREQGLDEAFEELNLAFPRMQTLQNLRQDDLGDRDESFRRLETSILLTFRLVVVFAREVTEYYSSKWRRVKDTVRPEQMKDRTLAEIRKTISQIRHECDILMLTKVSALQHKITDLQHQIDEMSKRVAATHDQSVRAGSQLKRARESADTSYLADLRQLLGVEQISIHKDLEGYKSLLAKAFSPANLRSKYCRPKEVSMELLRGDREFEKWWESSTSCLLLAGGTNFVDNHSSGSLNWLSYAAILAVEELRLNNRKVAFFLAQTDWTVSSRRHCSSRQILASLIYQIAEMHDDLLRSKLDKLRTAVQSPTWNAGSSNAFMYKTHSLLLDIFSAFPKEEEIFLVIDRLDQCSWEVDEDGDRSADMRRTIEGLLRVAAEASCHVKVLLTVDAASSQKLARAKTVLPKKERKALLLKKEWCQATDEGRSDEF